MATILCAVLGATLVPACGMPVGGGEGYADMGPDADVDGDLDADTDADMDADTDADTDSDSDTDADTGCRNDSDCSQGQQCLAGACVAAEVCDDDLESSRLLYLSADDSNSQASPMILRSLLRRSQHISLGALRTYEFLNYYRFDYAPADTATVRVVPQIAPVAGDPKRFELQIGVVAEALTDDLRRPLNLTLCLDTSGSMGGEPIELLRETSRAIASRLRSGDLVSMVEWDVHNAVLLDSHEVTGPDDAVLLDKIFGLQAGGGTNLEAGLAEAYRLARENFSSDRINRVVLISDGQANVGVTDETLIAAEADDADGEAIYLVGVGCGDGYNDTLMNAVTDAGKGAYLFIDSAEEAWKQFSDRLISNLEVAARNVRVELTMPAMFRMDEYHGEDYSGNPDAVEPQHLAPNDAMVFHQVIAACTEAIPSHYAEFTFRATFEDPFTREARAVETGATLSELLERPRDELIKGGAVVAYAELAKDLAGSRVGLDVANRCSEAIARVDEAQRVLAGDVELVEIAQMVRRLCGR